MTSDKAYMKYIMEQLSGVGDIEARPMMGVYVLYHHGKVFGGIYDNRFCQAPLSAVHCA